MTILEFENSRFNLIALIGDKVVFESNAKALVPLMNFISKNLTSKDLIVFDRIVGRAAALLFTLVMPKKIYTPIISKKGKEILEKYGIEFEAEKIVDMIMDFASEESCKWEKLAIGKSAKELYELLAK